MLIAIISILVLSVIGLIIYHQLKKKSDAARKAKADLLSRTSHDIRTPMNAMTGFITMAKKNVDDKEKVLDCLDKIEISGQQLLAIISKVLEAARTEAGITESKEKPADITKENGSPEKSDFSGKRVLLVEDNELNREIAKYLLEDMGLTVDEAQDGDVAVEMVMTGVNYFGRDYYDCILMDIEMPHLNGYKATGKIREVYDYENIHVPIIALSANALEEDKRNSIEAGMDAHISKPIDIDELNQVLTKFLK